MLFPHLLQVRTTLPATRMLRYSTPHSATTQPISRPRRWACMVHLSPATLTAPRGARLCSHPCSLVLTTAYMPQPHGLPSLIISSSASLHSTGLPVHLRRCRPAPRLLEQVQTQAQPYIHQSQRKCIPRTTGQRWIWRRVGTPFLSHHQTR